MTKLPTEKIAKQKAEQLSNSLPFDVHRWSEYPEVNGAVDFLYEQYRKSYRKRLKQKVQKKHIKVLVLDLYVKYLIDPKMYIAISRRRQDYVDGQGRYNKLHIGYVTVALMDWLHQEALIEMYIGCYGRDGIHSSRRTRIRATAKLVHLLEEKHSIKPHMIMREPTTECIILRDQDKKDIEYEDTANTIKMRKDLTDYNNLLIRTHIDIPDAPGQRIPRKTSRGEEGPKYIRIGDESKFVRRVFNNGSWEEGGRYAGGWWQYIPKEWREKIRINNLPTSEIDYANLHIVLLYARIGMDYWTPGNGDAYSLPEYGSTEQLRNLLKLVLLVAINSESKVQAVKAVEKEINLGLEFQWVKSSEINIKELIDHFAERHQPIQHFFFSGNGLELQYLDSRMAEIVINHFTSAGIPVLCIHDSFVIQADKSQELQDVMNQAYRTILKDLGVDGQAKVKPSGMKPGEWQEIQRESTGRDYRRLHKKQQLVLLDHPEYSDRFGKHVQRIQDGEIIQDWYRID